MKKVGLITFFINNYGSLMQAYATKAFLIKNGYTPVLIQKEPFGITEEEYKNNLKKHPEFEKDFKSFMDSLVKNDSLVPEESEKEMDAFREKVLQVSRFTMPEIRDMGQSDEYMAFIVGSDQVWNTTIGIVDEYFFLGFAPEHKRVALCPSFGAGSVHEYLRDEISDALNGFEALSSREDEGVRLIKELTGRDALRLSDPTILLTTEEWKEFAGVSGADEKGYLMLHFLDKPYDIAVKNVKKI
ncbi:MAG: polysaccharide pyruvyl transferase family protein, partial [Eubacterium sp.]|nr:polysaccharide pyruvyl transferase family protein [Eubacterium sp.]